VWGGTKGRGCKSAAGCYGLGCSSPTCLGDCSGGEGEGEGEEQWWRARMRMQRGRVQCVINVIQVSVQGWWERWPACNSGLWGGTATRARWERGKRGLMIHELGDWRWRAEGGPPGLSDGQRLAEDGPLLGGTAISGLLWGAAGSGRQAGEACGREVAG
jgi:hypothetical protein